MAAHQEHTHKQKHRHYPNETDGNHQHESDFEVFDHARDGSAIVFIGELPGRCGEQHEGQDEQSADHGTSNFRIQPAPLRRVIGRQHGEGKLENIVVAGAQELRPEKRRKASLRQELKLAFGWWLGHEGLYGLRRNTRAVSKTSRPNLIPSIRR